MGKQTRRGFLGGLLACVVTVAVSEGEQAVESLLRRRQAVEQALGSAGVGEVTDAGGGGGVMDICLETQDVARALPIVHAAIQEAGFTEAARVEVRSLDRDDDGEDPAAKDEAR